MLRSVLAVLAGLIVLTVVSFGLEAIVDFILMAEFPARFPDIGALQRSGPANAIMIAYTIASVVLGGYVTAVVARRLPVRHAVIMGAVEVCLTVLAMFSARGNTPILTWVITVLLTIPAGWLGANFYAGRITARRAAR